MTCTVCCSATAAVARNAPRPPFCRNRVDSANPPTPAGVVVAANVLATCMITRFLKLTSPSAQAHNAAAAPIYVSAETASPSSAHHQFAVSQFGEERRHRTDERVGDVDQRDEQHQLDDLAAGEPGDRLGLDLIGPGLPLHLVASGGHNGAGDRPPTCGFVMAWRTWSVDATPSGPRPCRRHRPPRRPRPRRHTTRSSSPEAGRRRPAAVRRWPRIRRCRTRRSAPCLRRW